MVSFSYRNKGELFNAKSKEYRKPMKAIATRMYKAQSWFFMLSAFNL